MEKCKFRPQKLPIDIYKKNETQSYALNKFQGIKYTQEIKSYVCCYTTVPYRNVQKFKLNAIYCADEFGVPDFVYIKPFFIFK